MFEMRKPRLLAARRSTSWAQRTSSPGSSRCYAVLWASTTKPRFRSTRQQTATSTSRRLSNSGGCASTTRLMRICTWRGALSTANAQRTPALPGGGSSPGSSECEGKTKKVQCLFVTLCIPPLKNDAKKQNNTNPLPCGSVKQTKLLVCCYSAGSLNLSRSRPRKRQVEAAGSCQEVPKYGGACRL